MNYEELMPKLRGIIPRRYLKFSCEDKSLLYELIDPKRSDIRDKVEQSSDRNFSAYISKSNTRSICSFAKEILEGCSPTTFTNFLYEVDNEDTGENGEVGIKLAARFCSDFAEITENNANDVIGSAFYHAIKEASERRPVRTRNKTESADTSSNRDSEIRLGQENPSAFYDDVEVLDLIEKIEIHKPLYVETKAFETALELIEKTNRLLIVGSPGIGKSFTSEMIVQRFLGKDFGIRFSTQTENLKSIITKVAADPQKKELVFIDDCLGQAYMTLNSDQESDLKRLISIMRRMKNKYLLLNSRIAILNKTKMENRPIGEVLKSLYAEKSVLNIESLSEMERALIFYKHLLSMNGITNVHYKSLQLNGRYLNIINHRNYNPRLIWHVTQDIFLEGKKPEEYYDDVLFLLNHPKMIWTNEYSERLCLRDRLLLTTLYSMTDGKCNFNDCRIAYESRLKKEQGIDHTVDNWSIAISVLNGAFVSIGKDGDFERTISVINPSVNDFLAESIMKKNSPECEKQKESIVFAVQLSRLYQDEYENAFFIKLKDHTILDLVFESDQIKDAYISYLVGKFGLLDPVYKKNVNRFIQNGCPLFYLKKSFDAVTVFSELVRHVEVTEYYFLEIDAVSLFSTFFHHYGTGLENLCCFVDSVTNYNPFYVRFLSSESYDTFCDVLDEMIECEYQYESSYVFDLVYENPETNISELNSSIVHSVQDNMEECINGDSYLHFRIPKPIGNVMKDHIHGSWYDYSEDIKNELSSIDKSENSQEYSFMLQREEILLNRIKICELFDKERLK